MKYMGSKARIAKHILPIMLEEAEKKGITTWVEPMVGGGGMIDKVPDTFERIGYDFNEHVIFAMKDIRDRAKELPESITEEYYKEIRGNSPEMINSWLRFVASFGGKFDDGFAREKPDSKSAMDRGFVRNFVMEAKRNALKQSPKIQGVEFIHSDYRELDIHNSLIYCDPPYQSSTGYKTGAFDHDKFFDWCREQAKKNVVFVSEYNAPEDFVCVWQQEVKSSLSANGVAGGNKVSIEKLFKVVPNSN